MSRRRPSHVLSLGLCLVLWTLLARGAAAPDTQRPVLESGVFLVADMSLGDPNFSQSVVLITAYGPEGALGVIVNREHDVKLGTALPDTGLAGHEDTALHFGGPVSPQSVLALVRADSPPPASEQVFDGVYVTGRLDNIADSLPQDTKRANLRVYAGYAGWAPGQLDAEYARKDWHIASADDSIIFDADTQDIWPQLIDQYRGTWVKVWRGLAEPSIGDERIDLIAGGLATQQNPRRHNETRDVAPLHSLAHTGIMAR